MVVGALLPYCAAARFTSRMPRPVFTPRVGFPPSMIVTRIMLRAIGPPAARRGAAAVGDGSIVAHPAAATAAPAKPACFRNSLRLPSMTFLLLVGGDVV